MSRKGEAKCYYPLRWVLFISTISEKATQLLYTMLLPTTLGSFHFYHRRDLHEEKNIMGVITHYVGFFSFLQKLWRIIIHQ